MKRTRFTEGQIVTILKEAEAGIPVEELSRKYGFSKSAFYKWKAKYSGMDTSSLRRLKELEEENQRLKRMYAELSLERQACGMLNLSRSVYRYQAKKGGDEEIAKALLELTSRKPRWGFGKMQDYLRNEAHGWNHKRIRRVYCDLHLNLRVKPKKRLPRRIPQPLIQPEQPNHSWSIDFMSDSLTSGRAFRTFNILDDFNREALWIEVDTSLPAERVIRVLEMIISWRGCPIQIRMDNGPEFISHRLESWAKQHNIQLVHIQPGKPSQNAYIERFNRTYREDVLDAYLFNSLSEVREISEQWLEEYNAIRPHEALEGLPPINMPSKMPDFPLSFGTNYGMLTRGHCRI
ncbi:MAG: IS3 family transposase [Anaerolineaceae bacterium]